MQVHPYIYIYGIIIMSVSLDDWDWSRPVPIKGLPVIKTHDCSSSGSSNSNNS
jgi:hypothetical protein